MHGILQGSHSFKAHRASCRLLPAKDLKREQGFSSIEILTATAITLVLLGAAMSSFNDAMGLNNKGTLMVDVEQNMRAGLNLLVRDFISAGWGIPTGGIPIPSGTGARAVIRPGPPGTAYTFAGAQTISAVNPGAGLGPAGNGEATDIVNILYADNALALNQSTLSAVAANAASVTVNAGTPITGITNPVSPGNLLFLSNALGNTLQYVTRVSGQTIYFDSGDPLNLNQPTAPQGSAALLQSGGVFPPTTATRVYLVTYYLDYTTDPTAPRLVRRVNNNAGQAVALIVSNLQLSYNLVDGVTNPTDVKTPVAPNSSNQIRMVNILLYGQSELPVQNTGNYLQRSLTTQVSLRSLSYYNRY
jgi:Tfp pilus assembly protein PilW